MSTLADMFTCGLIHVEGKPVSKLLKFLDNDKIS